MKGVVFNEFFQFVEDADGEDILDEVILGAGLAHGGAYTRVGTYPFDEMLRLVGAHVAATGREVPALLDGFGQHCFASWVCGSPAFFGPGRALFDVLAQIDGFHEREVRKLYPDAELPSFVVEQRSADRLVIGYHSAKQLTDLAIGVIKGAARHLGCRIEISATPAEGPAGPYARLSILLLGGAVPTEAGPAAACPHAPAR